MKGLLALADKALEQLGSLTFSEKAVETKPSKNGNVGFKVTTDQGKVVTFWKSNMDTVIEVVDEAKGLYKVIPGTQITEDGALISADSKSNGFWS